MDISKIQINNVNYNLKDTSAIASGTYDSSSQKIVFKNKDNVVICQIDATPFVVDGMVSNVAVSDGSLVITFNTDAGKSPISIPLTDIFNPSEYYTKIGYFVCDTAANTAAKTINAAGFVLSTGGSIKIKMTNNNTANNATLNINSTGAKPLYYAGLRTSSTNTWESGETIEVYYDGTNYMANNVAGGGGDGVFDVSVKTGDTYGSLSAALTAMNALPAAYKKGGMSIKYVQSSDNNSVYVQYRLMADAFTTDTAQWQGVDEVLIAGSKNLVESGVVELALRTVPKQLSDSSDANLNISDENGNVITRFEDGHIKTKNFNSEIVVEKLSTIEEGAEKNNIDSFFDGGSADLNVCDGSGNVIVQFKEGHIRTKEFNSRNVHKKTIRICALGNSWTGDAFNYLGALLDEMFAGEVDVHIGWAYKSGCTLQEHYDRSQNNGSYTYYYYWQTSVGKWTRESDKKFDSIITSEPWDIIITQQMSDKAPDYATYQPYLNDLIDNIRLKTTRTIKIGWIATRAKPKTSVAAEIEMYEDVISAVQQMVNDTIVDFVIPNGTATQNARTTSLVNLGTNRLTTDGSHLQEGVPCLIESYCTALKIAEVFGYPYRGILGSDFLPTQEWIDANGCQGQANGDSTGTDSDNNILLAQKCAIMAVKFPSVITDCGTLFESI